jgi:fumarate reductase flavoprotein subunit
VSDEVRRIEHDVMGEVPRDDSVAAIRDGMQETMEDAAGIYRTGEALDKGTQLLRELQDRLPRVGVRDTSRSWNTELVATLEAANMLDVAECMLASALEREESRGAHQRLDFTARDDENFLVHQLNHRSDDGRPRVESVPVTITRWPPGERVYGR